MDYGKWNLDGRSFRTGADYEAALRDHKKIEEIRRRTDLKDPKEVAALYVLLQSGELRFETILGRDFDDEIYELKEQFKKDSANPVQKQGLFSRKQKADKAVKRREPDKLQEKRLRQSIHSSAGSAGRSGINAGGEGAGNRKAKTSAAEARIERKAAGIEKRAAGLQRRAADQQNKQASRQSKAAGSQRKIAGKESKAVRGSSKRALKKAERERQAIEKQERLLKKSRVDLSGYDEAMRREILRQLARQEKRRKLIVSCCSVIAVLSLGYFSIYNYYYARTERSARQLAELKSKGNYGNLSGTVHKTGDEGKPDILEQYRLLYIKNKSLIGWIQIDDTKIDYPVMQTSNAEYYLTHNFDQEVDKNGSIFLDPLCDVLKPSTNLIIYGHHMKSGNMFGGLDKYSKKEYYEKHKIIQFDSIYEEGTYEVMYVFRSRIYYEDEITFKYYQFINANSEAEFNSAMDAMAEMSLYDTGVTARYGDSLLTLSTCDNSEEDGRFVVVARRVS